MNETRIAAMLEEIPRRRKFEKIFGKRWGSPIRRVVFSIVLLVFVGGALYEAYSWFFSSQTQVTTITQSGSGNVGQQNAQTIQNNFSPSVPKPAQMDLVAIRAFEPNDQHGFFIAYAFQNIGIDTVRGWRHKFWITYSDEGRDTPEFEASHFNKLWQMLQPIISRRELLASTAEVPSMDVRWFRQPQSDADRMGKAHLDEFLKHSPVFFLAVMAWADAQTKQVWLSENCSYYDRTTDQLVTCHGHNRTWLMEDDGPIVSP